MSSCSVDIPSHKALRTETIPSNVMSGTELSSNDIFSGGIMIFKDCNSLENLSDIFSICCFPKITYRRTYLKLFLSQRFFKWHSFLCCVNKYVLICPFNFSSVDLIFFIKSSVKVIYLLSWWDDIFSVVCAASFNDRYQFRV